MPRENQIEIRPAVIRKELAQALTEIELQIEAVKKHADGLGFSVYTLRDANGGWVYIPLLAAKASVLAALTQNNSR